MARRGREAVSERVFQAAKSRVDRVRELCDKAGEKGSVSVVDLRKIVGGGE